MSRNLGQAQVEKKNIWQRINRSVVESPSSLEVIDRFITSGDPKKQRRGRLFEHNLQILIIGLVVFRHEDLQGPRFRLHYDERSERKGCPWLNFANILAGFSPVGERSRESSRRSLAASPLSPTASPGPGGDEP